MTCSATPVLVIRQNRIRVIAHLSHTNSK